MVGLGVVGETVVGLELGDVVGGFVGLKLGALLGDDVGGLEGLELGDLLGDLEGDFVVGEVVKPCVGVVGRGVVGWSLGGGVGLGVVGGVVGLGVLSQVVGVSVDGR